MSRAVEPPLAAAVELRQDTQGEPVLEACLRRGDGGSGDVHRYEGGPHVETSIRRRVLARSLACLLVRRPVVMEMEADASPASTMGNPRTNTPQQEATTVGYYARDA